MFCLTSLAKEIYNATNEVRSAIPHPRIMGVIKECGGKMWMGEREFKCYFFITSFSERADQDNGTERARISSSPSAIMTRRVHHSAYKC